MAPGAAKAKSKKDSGATLGFEATMWAAADKLRGHMDAAEYKHVVLGLVFLKYISDAFERLHAKLENEAGADPEDPDGIGPRTSSGSRWRPAGRSSRTPPSSPRSAFC